jgi:hypothetical protein
MFTAILALIAGLLISGVAIYYSVAGLVNIFAAAAVPIIIMGTSLEIAKLVATVWLKQNWNVAPRLLKAYLIVAVAILMAITSMGIFGFLSKAHSDQTLVSGDVQSRIEIYDQKIQTSRENIEANRRALTQLDAAVDQTLGRSTDEAGAARAVSVRRSQRTERARLLREIEEEQATITKLNEESAPIKAQSREVEAKVGPIKYIAQLIYGDNPDANLLEKSVSWMIIMIVIVFDPLALALLLASQYSFQQLRKKDEEPEDNFAETFLESKGTVDPEIDLEFDEPEVVEETLSEAEDDIQQMQPEIEEPVAAEEELSDIFEQIEDRTIEGNTVIDPEREAAKTKIIHTKEGMIIEDAAGTQVIATPDVHVLDNSYLVVDGNTYYHKALDDDSTNAYDLAKRLTGYVQNEEQQESSKWSEILNKPANISEEQYLKAAIKRRQQRGIE